MSLRSKCQFIAATCVIGLCVVWPVTANAGTHTADISIKDFFFEPDGSVLKVGDTVRLRNDGTTAHAILGTNLGSESRLLAPGETFTFELSNEELMLSCAIHVSMRLDLVVTTPPPTTMADLAYTGPGSTNAAALGIAALSLGLGAWLLRQRRCPLATTSGGLDSLLPTAEHERRRLKLRPPLES